MTQSPSTNGSSLLPKIAETHELLEGLDKVAYYGGPMPSEADEQLRRLVNWFRACGPDDRSGLMNNLTPAERAYFGLFGHRAATLSMRQENAGWLWAGLAGYAMANWTVPDSRRVEPALAVYYYCATKLGEDPQRLFEMTAELASDEMRPILVDFGNRKDVRLSSFGWREIRTTDGIKFKFEYR